MKAFRVTAILLFQLIIWAILPVIKQASAQEIIISHSVSIIIEPETAISCNQNGINYENSYYRNFDLFNDFRINEEWIVQKIRFGAALAQSSDGSQPITLKLYSLPESSPLLLDSMTLLHSQSILYYDSDSEQLKDYNLDDIIAVPRKHNLAVEILIPDGQNDGNYFFIASNALGQTDPSYIRAPECNVDVPTNIASIGYPDMHIIMTVHGEYASPSPEILSFSMNGQIGSTQILNEPDYTVSLLMPYDSALTNLIPNIVVPAGFTVTPASGEAVDFSQGAVTYTVSNETAKVAQSWDVSVGNTDADILSFYIEGQVGDTEINGAPDFSINISMPSDTTIDNLEPEIQLWPDFLSSPATGEAVDFSQGPVIYTVQHENSDYAREWTVNVTQEISSVYGLQAKGFSVSPNPTTNYLYIQPESLHKPQTKIKLMNMLGQIVFTQSADFSSREPLRLMLPQLPNGMYLLIIRNNSFRYTEKIQIQH